MKTKLLSFLLAACLLGLAAWVVDRNNRPEVMTSNGFAPAVQGAEPNAPAPDEIPEKYRDTVAKGLEFLVKHQHEDGHWEGDDGKHPVAMTGLAGLALLMDRELPEKRSNPVIRDSKYAANVRKGADWLIGKSQGNRDGLIFSEHASETARYMQGHGLATLFLAGVCKDEQDNARRAKLTDVLMRAVKYIVKSRSTQGGWYHTSKVEGHDFADISATAIQVQALKAAENAGIPVSDDAINGAQGYLIMALEKYEKEKRSGQARSRLVETAGTLACSFGPNPISRRDRKEDLRDKWLNFCRTSIPMGRDMMLGRDELVHFYYAQALFNQDADAWKSYRDATFDYLKSSQNKDGSWPAGDGIGVGQVYSTAVWCIVLQIEKRSHPSMRSRVVVIE